MSDHTPTPWSISKHAGGNIISENGRVTANCMGYSSNKREEDAIGENNANAALIIKAVNAHERLVERLHYAMVAMGHASWFRGTPEQRQQFSNINKILIEMGVATNWTEDEIKEAGES